MPERRWFLRLLCAEGTRLLPVEQVLEVVPLVNVEHFDGGDGSIGFVHLRGELVPLFSPGNAAPSLSLDKYIVLIQGPEGRAAILADDVHEVIEAGPDQCRDAGTPRRLAGVMLDEGFVRALDTTRVLP